MSKRGIGRRVLGKVDKTAKYQYRDYIINDCLFELCSSSELNEIAASMKKIGSFWIAGGTIISLPALYPASSILTSMLPSNAGVSVPKPHCHLQQLDCAGGRELAGFILQLYPKLYYHWAALECQ
jgi:hypothetical protein